MSEPNMQSEKFLYNQFQKNIIHIHNNKSPLQCNVNERLVICMRILTVSQMGLLVYVIEINDNNKYKMLINFHITKSHIVHHTY